MRFLFNIFRMDDYLNSTEHPMRPNVILHTAMSLDGRITNFPADLELYYSLSARWNPDAILFGSSTILAAPSLEVPPEHTELFRPPTDCKNDPRPLMVVADSRGVIRCWETLKKWPYFRGFVALCSAKTPREYLDYLAEHQVGTIIAGPDQVDLRSVLERLYADYGAVTIRADSGGALNSVLLDTGLVTEVSVLIHPFLAGGSPEPTIFDPARAGLSGFQVPLNLTSCETLRDGIVHARYIPVT